MNPTPTTGHLGFSPVIPMTGEAVIESQRVFARVLQESGRDVAANVFPQSYHPRTFVILIMFYGACATPRSTAHARAVQAAVEVAAEHGWGEYRTHTAFMDDCARAYCVQRPRAAASLQERSRTPSTRTACWRRAATASGRRHLRRA